MVRFSTLKHIIDHILLVSLKLYCFAQTNILSEDDVWAEIVAATTEEAGVNSEAFDEVDRLLAGEFVLGL